MKQPTLKEKKYHAYIETSKYNNKQHNNNNRGDSEP